MKIHWPSIGIGIGVMVAIIVVAFFIFGQNFMKTPQSEFASQNPPNPTQKAALAILTGNSSPVLGSQDAPIMVVEFGDYQ